METRALKPYFVVIALLISTSVLLAVTVDVKVTNEAGIKVFLPEQIGDWKGSEIRFCQDPECQRDFIVNDLEDRDVCPACGGELGCMSYPEALQLPDDTVVLKKRYEDSAGRVLFVAIVLSGKERASIHRPQICLVGQGREIVKSSVLEVPIENREDLGVMVLDMLQPATTASGEKTKVGQFYAYWFVGKGRETPYHVQRMAWMAMDRIFFNVSHRWAYISVAGSRELSSDKHSDLIKEFVHELYPHMVREDV